MEEGGATLGGAAGRGRSGVALGGAGGGGVELIYVELE